jgi:hypothetical protein
MPHVRHTAERLLEQTGVVLCLHDTTELDFTRHACLRDQLGPIGDGNGRGYECHNSLVVLPGARQVLGLLAQQLHHRAAVAKGETPAQRRQREDRESLLWPRGIDAAAAAVVQACHARGLDHLPAGLRVVDVFDRGGDSFELHDLLDSQRRSYVGRSFHNRHVRLGHDQLGTKAKLHAHLRSLPLQGRRQVTVRDHQGGPSRQAQVAICWAAVLLLRPQQPCGYSRRQPLAVWALRVWEPEPPPGVKPIEWFLLSNVAVASVADAWERVDWYCLRWVIEEYHKAQKTGCVIEGPQFETTAALEPMIALLSVVATTLLNLRAASQDEQLRGRPATEVVGALEGEVLAGWRHGQRRQLLVEEFYQALARLGGHPNRRQDRPPGWLVLWRGWQALQLMLAGARAARTPRAPPASS